MRAFPPALSSLEYASDAFSANSHSELTSCWMVATPSASTGAMVLRSPSSCVLAASAFCCELASKVTARLVSQYFKSPKCLLASFAFLTIETSRASSASASKLRASSRVRSADATARIASSMIARKISRTRIEKYDIGSFLGRPLPQPRHQPQTGIMFFHCAKQQAPGFDRQRPLTPSARRATNKSPSGLCP